MSEPQLASQKHLDRVLTTATHLSLVEIAIGSIVHGLKLPLAGHTLSLNQGLFLCHALRDLPERRQAIRQSVEISSITAILKSLSPAGNKIGPMLSISMQGFLFSVGLLIGGAGLFGQILGMLLLSLWAFIQPLVTLFLIHGFVLARVLDFYWQRMTTDLPKMADSVVIVLLGVVSLKMLLALVVPLIAHKLSDKQVNELQNKIRIQFSSQLSTRKESPRSTWRGVWHDLTRPFFIFSMALVISFFWLTESDYVRIFWFSLRPLAVAIIIFYLVRSPRIAGLLSKLARKNQTLDSLVEKTQNVYQMIYKTYDVSLDSAKNTIHASSEMTARKENR